MKTKFESIDSFVIRILSPLSSPDVRHHLIPASAPVIEHAQQLPGVHALLLRHLLHVEAHVLQELDHAHLLSRQLVSYSRAGGITVRPRAAVNQMERAAPGVWGLRLLVVVGVVVGLEAAVPAVQRSGQGGALHMNVHPVGSCDEFM